MPAWTGPRLLDGHARTKPATRTVAGCLHLPSMEVQTVRVAGAVTLGFWIAVGFWLASVVFAAIAAMIALGGLALLTVLGLAGAAGAG